MEPIWPIKSSLLLYSDCEDFWGIDKILQIVKIFALSRLFVGLLTLFSDCCDFPDRIKFKTDQPDQNNEDKTEINHLKQLPKLNHTSTIEKYNQQITKSISWADLGPC